MSARSPAIVGATALDGLIVATGHYRNGILLAPVTADQVTVILQSGEDRIGDSGLLSGFGPERFSGAR